MKQRFFLTLAVTLMAAVPILTTINTSQATTVAGPGPIIKINSDGFKKCRAFDANGTKSWTAKIRGRLVDNSGTFQDKLNIKTCFTTKAACDKFVNRIHNLVLGIEEIRYTRCSIRNG